MEQWWMWAVFGVVVMTTLMIDLLVFHRKPHAMSLREASAWTGVWVSLAALFAGAVFATEGSGKGLEFVTGYIIEWSLSVDNLFVFLVIFSYFAVPLAFQHRVLFWGIMGAVIMRGIFIAAGVGLLAWFHWMIYVFGVFLDLHRRRRGPAGVVPLDDLCFRGLSGFHGDQDPAPG